MKLSLLLVRLRESLKDFAQDKGGESMSSFENYTINFNRTCKEAMKRIDDNELKILFVVDSFKLLATLTDGDIRRYLISGGNLDDQVLKAGNKQPRIAHTLEEAYKLYQKNEFIAIPIVNNGQLIDIYFGKSKERIYKKIDCVKVVINAGGKGTRLDPYTRVLPKPLIPVGDLPIIEIIMQEYKKYSLSNFLIIVNYKKDLIKAYFNEAENHYAIEWYDENKPLGTGGGLALLKGRINGTFFFANCDCLLTADYESMLRYHREHNNAITMVCAYKNMVVPYGVIKLGNNGSISEMVEKPEFSFLTNTGMYIVEPDVLNDIEDNVAIGFPDIIKKEQEKGKNIGVYPISENEWMDMGQLDELEKMRVKMYGK